MLLARTDAVIEEASRAGPAKSARTERDPLVYDVDWYEDGRLEEWRGVLQQIDDLPSVLQAIVAALDAWNEVAVLQHDAAPAGVTTAAHLAAFNLGLKTIPADRRRHRDRESRLLAIAQGLTAAAEIGLKEHDRVALARQMMERKLAGRRISSKLPELIEPIMSRPLISAGMVGKSLGDTPQAARRTVGELGLREMTGRGRFRAWGVV
ncbi:RHE_PE00001 family protein (plasmid) [Sinorhizobium meliloti]|nr:RHE_PE00001 family protein [Sinorhizobium meliloti]WQO97356.1 RHE_PE00001 family protein [Sinorhizobium meliloti]